MKKTLITLLIATVSTFALTVGEIPKDITLSGDNGARVDGTAWQSRMLKDKVHVLFYVDPDKKEDNDAFIEALHKKNYDTEQYASVAIINLKATWLPNFAIEKKLKSKQKEFPNTIYVKDKTKYLVQEWALPDDASNVLIFDKKGKLIYQHEGAVSNDEMQKAFALIEENLNK
jgi:predicted transcriptional regulator